ncbi:MAG: NAD-dependent deacetylase [Epsilonproteobacteria bacterium]|nr:NAD-dependent deacetylase [Campylobacterota bacterium]
MIEQAKQLIKNADALLITAGAGMGVDSGLPDFRGVEGFWNAYPAIKNLGLRFEEMANPRWFEEDPTLAWAFYGHRLNLYRETIPHEGFSNLLALTEKKEGKYFVFTSNVDGQFQKAGFNEQKITEVHGSIHHFQCTKNCTTTIWKDVDTYVTIDPQTFRAHGDLPRCPTCGEIARPNILMFGDWAWNSERTDIQSQKLQNWLDDVKANNYKLVILEFGAGLAVPTIRFFGENILTRYNASLIRVNPRDTNVPHGQIAINTGAVEAINNLLGSS